MNVYQCRFGVDVEIVVGGCPETGVSEQSEHCARGSLNPARVPRYDDVHPNYYQIDDDRFFEGSLFYGVNRLCNLGVLEGTDCGENLFCPFDPVDGATFATWLVRVLGEDTGGPDGAVGRLVELGVAGRCADQFGGLCPGEGFTAGRNWPHLSPEPWICPNRNRPAFGMSMKTATTSSTSTACSPPESTRVAAGSA